MENRLCSCRRLRFWITNVYEKENLFYYENSYQKTFNTREKHVVSDWKLALDKEIQMASLFLKKFFMNSMKSIESN